MAKKKKRKRRSGKSISPQLKERAYQSGLSYFREGEYEQAISAWSGIVKNSGHSLAAQLAEAHFRNAISKYESGNMKAVISELHSALKYDAPNQPVCLFHIGLAHHRMGKLRQAISFYTRTVQAEPEVERYRYHLGLAHLQNGEIQESIELFEAIKGINGRIGEALAYIAQGDHERALAVFDAARGSDNGEFKFLEGLVYLAQEKNKEAKRLLKAAASREVGSGVSDYYLGIAHVRTDAIPSAVDAWKNASQKGLNIEAMTDDIANVYRQLAVRYFDRGNLSKVVKIWEKLLEMKPGDDETLKNLVHAYFLRANDYAKAEQFTYAIRYWEKAWELDSTNADIAHNLALAHENRNELREAVKYWKAAATGWKRQGSAGEKEILKARMHTVHIHLAEIALKVNNMGRAIAECHQALRYAPEDVRTIVRLADLHLMQGSGSKAAQLLSRARRLSPEDADILQQLSLAYAMKGDFNRSVECMKEILKIDPGNQLYQEMVGQHYLSRAEDALRMKKHAAALRLLDEGIEICPGNIDLRAFVGAVYLDMKDKHKAEVAFQETIAISSTDSTDAAKPYIAVAHHYLDNEMEDDAEAYFAKVIELDPHNPRIYVDIAREYCAFDLCVQSRKYFEKAKKVNPGDPSVLRHIVEVLMERECAEYGLPYAKELMKIAPDDPRSYYLLGLAYHFSDMSDEAMDTLLEGTDVAEQTGDDEMMDRIEGLYSHIEFENSFGSLWGKSLDQLRRMFGDMEEW